MEKQNYPKWNHRSSAPGPLPKKERGKKERNKAGYTANTSCAWVGRGGNARFPTLQLEREGPTNRQTDKDSYRIACPQLKRKVKEWKKRNKEKEQEEEKEDEEGDDKVGAMEK